MKLLIKILLLLLMVPALAQENQYTYVVDSTDQDKKLWSPTGVRLGFDLLGPALHFFDDRNLNYEFTADVDFDKYYLVAEIGFQQFQEVNNNVGYDMRGSYFRLGPEVNFLHRDKFLNNVFFGLRYAWANYNEVVVGDVEEPNWGSVPVNFDVNNRSWWVEMTTGVKVRLVKNFFTGYVLRFRFARSTTDSDVPFTSYYVPGYGYAERVNTWGFRYYVMYRFQWKKKPVRTKRKD